MTGEVKMNQSINKDDIRPIKGKRDYKKAVKKATQYRLKLEREEERISDYFTWLRTKRNSQEI